MMTATWSRWYSCHSGDFFYRHSYWSHSSLSQAQYSMLNVRHFDHVSGTFTIVSTGGTRLWLRFWHQCHGQEVVVHSKIKLTTIASILELIVCSHSYQAHHSLVVAHKCSHSQALHLDKVWVLVSLLAQASLVHSHLGVLVDGTAQ